MSLHGELIGLRRQSFRQLLLGIAVTVTPAAFAPAIMSTGSAVGIAATVTTIGALSVPVSANAGQSDTSGQSKDLVKSDPQHLLQEMVMAMESLNFIGEFVHVMDSKLEAMRIVHASTPEGELERLTSLNGEAREIFRDDEKLICILPGSNSLVVASSKDRQTIPRIDAEVLQSEFYESMHEGFDRVAGRDAHVISIMPVDQFRYGHKFWIDTDSKMLLRMTLLGESGGVMDQFLSLIHI